MNWEPIIGLEVHAELKTKSKMYCGCRNEFGGEPNSRCCPVCTGMPGTLPQLNLRAVEYAILAGLAVNATIAKKTRQYRKNYFYPDLPKGYQISQFTVPLCVNGEFRYFCGDEVKIARIRQIHIEEDAGKLIHLPDGDTQIDYNRCGVPLIEIVTQPDFNSPKQARTFLESVRTMLLYLGISDCRMQEGSLRCDVNVSVRKAGSDELMPRVEMKNINTFSGAERAIRYEVNRQIKILNDGGSISQQTRRWDDEARESFLLRTKENAADYRYFPEPDIPAIEISEDVVERIRVSLPECEFEKRRKYTELFQLPPSTAAQLSASPDLAHFFDKCVEIEVAPKAAANLILGQISSCVNDGKTKIAESGLTAESFTDIIKAAEGGEISMSAAKRAVAYLFEHGGNAREAIDCLGLSQISDKKAIEEIVVSVLNDNPQAIADYRDGKKNALGYLTGQCMRLSGGRANPQMLTESLKENLEGRFGEF